MAETAEEAIEKGVEIRGKVKRWLSRGFGFVGAWGGEEVFVHERDIRGGLQLEEGGIVVMKVEVDGSRKNSG